MTSADIVEMPVAERLKLMETLWESLCAQPGTRRIDSGEETVSSWKEAKARIRAQIKAD